MIVKLSQEEICDILRRHVAIKFDYKFTIDDNTISWFEVAPNGEPYEGDDIVFNVEIE